MYVYTKPVQKCIQSTPVRRCENLYECIYVYIYIYMCVCVYIHSYVYIHVYIILYMYMYVYIHILCMLFRLCTHI